MSYEGQAKGFGTLTEIDVRATLSDKLGEEMEPFLITGPGNPHRANQGLETEPKIGLLPPCKVVVRTHRSARCERVRTS